MDTSSRPARNSARAPDRARLSRRRLLLRPPGVSELARHTTPAASARTTTGMARIVKVPPDGFEPTMMSALTGNESLGAT